MDIQTEISVTEEERAYHYGRVFLNNRSAIEAALAARVETLPHDSEEFQEALHAQMAIAQALWP